MYLASEGATDITISDGMVRTQVDRAQYLKIARDVGFVDCACIPYNPYWKVNREGWFEDKVTLRAYTWHHKLKRQFLRPDAPSEDEPSLPVLLPARHAEDVSRGRSGFSRT